MLFRREPEHKTVVVLDIETGSVGGGLVHCAPGEAPRLLGETRIDIAAGTTRDSNTVRERVVHALQSVTHSLAQVAARVRGNQVTAPMGTPSRAVAFVAAPWGVPDLTAGSPRFDTALVSSVEHALAGTFTTPFSVHTRASATLNGARILLPYEDTYLVCMPHGEVSEILEVSGGSVRTHGTLPVGLNTLLRTAMSHGGLHEEEARSIVKSLSFGGVPPHFREPLKHVNEHIAAHFTDLAARHGWHAHERVYSFAHDGDWFARVLAESSAAKKFGGSAILKPIRAEHFSPHFSGHARVPDLGVMLGGLFVDAHYR